MTFRFRNTILCGLAVLLTQCTGSLPSQNSLPNIDGHEVKNVNATSVGDVSAATIQAMSERINAATAQGTAGTLVARDTSGAITATVNGSASFALGQKGTIIPSAAMLELPGDGNFFDVKNSVTVTDMSAKPPGARVTLRFVDGTLLKSSATFLLQGGVTSEFKTVANDVFEFLSTGSGWMEVSRMTTNESEAAAHRNTTVSVGVSTTYGYDVVDYDHQGEFSGGFFHAKQSGSYAVKMVLVTVGLNAGETCVLFMGNLSTADVLACHCVVDVAGHGCPIACGTTVHLAKGETAGGTLSCNTSSGTSLNVLSPTYNQIRIRRIGN